MTLLLPESTRVSIRSTRLLPAIVLSGEAARIDAEPQLRRAREEGRLHKIARGAYVDAATWVSMSPDDRERTRVRGFALLGPADRQYSHDSAATMLHLPTIGRPPETIHVTADRADGGVHRAGIRWHAVGTDAEPVTIDGVTITSLRRTVVDLVCSSTFMKGVAVADDAMRAPREGDPRWGWGLPAPSREELRRHLEERLPLRGSRVGRSALDFADERSGSAAESIYRVQFRALGFPAPILQHPVFDAAGLIGYLDFWFPTIGLGMEVDGTAKYAASRRYQRDLDPATIFRLEKKREDRLRDALPRFTRMEATLAFDRRAIAAHLRPFGLMPK